MMAQYSNVEKLFLSWLLTILVCAVLGLIGGVALDYWFYRLNVDYQPIINEYLFLGIRYGFFTGSIFGGLQIIDRRKPIENIKIIYALLITIFLILVGIILAFFIAEQLYQLNRLDTSDWRLANPKRYAISIGISHSLRITSIMGLITGSFYLIKQRQN